MFAKDMGTFQRTSQRGGRNPARVAVTNQCTAALDGMLSSESQSTKKKLRFRVLLSDDDTEMSLAVV